MWLLRRSTNFELYEGNLQICVAREAFKEKITICDPSSFEKLIASNPGRPYVICRCVATPPFFLTCFAIEVKEIGRSIYIRELETIRLLTNERELKVSKNNYRLQRGLGSCWLVTCCQIQNEVTKYPQILCTINTAR